MWEECLSTYTNMVSRFFSSVHVWKTINTQLLGSSTITLATRSDYCCDVCGYIVFKLSWCWAEWCNLYMCEKDWILMKGGCACFLELMICLVREWTSPVLHPESVRIIGKRIPRFTGKHFQTVCNTSELIELAYQRECVNRSHWQNFCWMLFSIFAQVSFLCNKLWLSS